MKTKKYVVYLHIFPNGKYYVGITCANPVNRRWRGGRPTCAGYKWRYVNEN